MISAIQSAYRSTIFFISHKLPKHPFLAAHFFLKKLVKFVDSEPHTCIIINESVDKRR